MPKTKKLVKKRGGGTMVIKNTEINNNIMQSKKNYIKELIIKINKLTQYEKLKESYLNETYKEINELVADILETENDTNLEKNKKTVINNLLIQQNLITSSSSGNEPQYLSQQNGNKKSIIYNTVENEHTENNNNIYNTLPPYVNYNPLNIRNNSKYENINQTNLETLHRINNKKNKSSEYKKILESMLFRYKDNNNSAETEKYNTDSPYIEPYITEMKTKLNELSNTSIEKDIISKIELKLKALEELKESNESNEDKDVKIREIDEIIQASITNVGGSRKKKRTLKKGGRPKRKQSKKTRKARK